MVTMRAAAISIAHLGVKLALFIGSFARASEISARLRIAADIILLPIAIATTAATSASASAPATTFATWPILRRPVTGFEGRRCVIRWHGDVAFANR